MTHELSRWHCVTRSGCTGCLACQHVTNCRCKRLRALKTVIRILGDGFFHHAVPGRCQRCVERRRRHGLLPQHLEHDAGQGPYKRFFAGQKLVQDDAAGKEVAAQVHRLALKLLGRHVGRCAHHGACHRELGRFNPRNPEVGNFHAAIVQHDEVGRLDVTVRDAVAVGVVQRIQNLLHDSPDVLQGKPFVLFKVASELAALDELHRDERHPLGLQLRVTGIAHDRVVVFGIDFTVFVHGNNARVVKAPRSLGLALEAGQHAGHVAAVKLRGQDGFDRNGALKHRIEPFVYHAHGTLAQFVAYQILTEFGDGRHGDHTRRKQPARGSPFRRSPPAFEKFNPVRHNAHAGMVLHCLEIAADRP